MRIILIALPLVLLVACNSGAPAGNAANDSAANAAAPAADNAAKPAEAGGQSAPAADPRRAGEIEECVRDVRTEVPEGTDLNAFCGCAVDRMQTGAGERDAMEACATQMGIQPRGE